MMTAASLVERVREHLGRQAAWLEEVLNELDSGRFDMQSPELTKALSAFNRRVDERKRMETEQVRLLREWHAAKETISEADRVDVRIRSAQVRELAKRVSKAYERVAVEVDSHRKRVGQSLAELGRGRRVLGKMYLDSADGWQMDRKA